MLISSLVLELDWQEIGKSEYSRLSFAQYLKTGANKEFQIWDESV